MKVFTAFVLLAMITGCGTTSVNTSDPNVLAGLIKPEEDQDYFKLKSAFAAGKNNLGNDHSLYYTAIIGGVFNEAEVSNAAISPILAHDENTLSDTMMNTLHKHKLLNHINLYEYGQAAAEALLNFAAM